LPSYVGDIWVLSLPIDQSRFVMIFVLGMEDLFKTRNKIVKVSHSRATSRLLNWIMKIDKVGVHRWMIENEDHVDFYDYS
jgi:hypothetical protein